MGQSRDKFGCYLGTTVVSHNQSEREEHLNRKKPWRPFPASMLRLVLLLLFSFFWVHLCTRNLVCSFLHHFFLFNFCQLCLVKKKSLTPGRFWWPKRGCNNVIRKKATLHLPYLHFHLPTMDGIACFIFYSMLGIISRLANRKKMTSKTSNGEYQGHVLKPTQ